ncbi:MAG: radical SAM protein [Kiritimatiellales bacterium]
MFFEKSHTLFRPPAEAESLILRVADGCPWNSCTFCGMYKGVRYQFHGLDAAEKEFTRAAQGRQDARRIFLADGDVMGLDFTALETMLILLNEKFPALTRVGIYANGSSILKKTDAELRRLQELKLHTLYMGLESGDDEILFAVNKRENSGAMIAAAQRAQNAGLRMSVMILIGLAGELHSMQHAFLTAQALNKMQPKLLSALRLVTTPNTPLYKSGFKMIPEYAAVAELRELIQHLELEQTVFRADHSSNIIPLAGRFPKDKERLLTQLDCMLASGRLDKKSPGTLPWSL